MQKDSAPGVKLRFALFVAMLLNFNLTDQEAVAQERLSQRAAEERLARAVHLIDTNPKLAAEELKRLNNAPSAQAYLSYLYLARKVVVSSPLTRVDSLMKKATESPQARGDIQPIKHYHYKDLEKLLRNLRFVATDVEVPMSIAKEHPAEFIEAFQPYWGSSMDAWPQLGYEGKSYDIGLIPQIQDYFSNLGDMEGETEGTIRFWFHRRGYMMDLKAELAPQLFLTNEAKKDIDPHLNDFLYKWSTYELWNKQKYEKWLSGKKGAENALSAYYQRTFKMQPNKATICATRALDSISRCSVGNYPPSELDELTPTSLYRLFRPKQLSLAQVQEHFAGKKASEKELADALRMAILNGHSLDIIEWLIKQGAPISGGTEPPLLSAALRPDVLKLLLRSGADIKEQNCIGKTALIQAAQYDCLESCKVLIAAGAEVNHEMVPPYGPDSSKDLVPDYMMYITGNRTALLYACQFASYPVIEYLLHSGAYATAKDSGGSTSRDYIKTNKKISQQQKLLLAKALTEN